LSVVLLLVLGGVLWAAYEYFAKDLPPVDDIPSVEFQSTRIYDRYGNLLYEMFDSNIGRRLYVPIEDIPESLILATIAVEDKSFEENPGVDPQGILRALYINLTNQGTSGGSTITQQLVRRMLLPEKDERTLTRKIREAILAMRVTQKYPKEKILELYLNEIYYGSMAYGVAAAADTYWGKQVKDLTLAEAAMLAGLPQAPGEYDPNRNFDLAKARQQIVLDLMVKNGFITEEEARAAYAEDVRPKPRPAHVPRSAPHFVQYVQQVLEEKYGPEMANRGGLKVFTTIDLQWQAEAQRIVTEQVENLKKQHASNAGLVAINARTGEILAMVGSVDYTDPVFGEVNVTTALRQPGSSFKPITYATAFQRGDFNPTTIILDAPVKYGGAGLLPYIPRNYDGRFHGPVTIRAALANSFNIPAVEVMNQVGVAAVIETASRMGITTLTDPERYGLSLTLGGGEVTLLEMTEAYATLANYGYHAPATPFLKIVGPDGSVLYELNRKHPEGAQALDRGVAYQISQILSDNDARTPVFGPNSPLKIDGIVAAAKTGTTNDWKDSWTMGYTPALAVGVWVGNNDGKPMARVAGAIGAAPIWHNFIKKVYSEPEMKALLLKPGEQQLPERFIPPAGMVGIQVCAVSGMLPGDACTHLRHEWFTLENAPKETCTWHRWVEVTLHDGGASVPGPNVPKSNIIERIYTFPPPHLKGWIGGGPPSKVYNGDAGTSGGSGAQPAPLPPSPQEEPPPVSDHITPVPGIEGLQRPRPVGLQQPENPQPIPGLQLAILSPEPGQVVSGLVMVLGQAYAANFARYRLEYGFGDGSVGSTTIVDSNLPPVGGVLGYWETGGLQPGPYTLRLVLETLSGEVVRTEVRIRVGSGPPLATILSPADGSPVYNGEAVEIVVSADGGGAPVAGVEIYVDGKRISSLLSPPWATRWAVITGTHEISAIVYTGTGEQAHSPPVRVFSAGPRPTPTPTRAPIMWISNLTEYEEIPAGVNEVWVDVAPGSQVHHVDIYIDGYPAGFATGPGFRVHPLWTPTPSPVPTGEPTATLAPEAAATATQVQATANAQATKTAGARATRTARAIATIKAQQASASATAASQAATATTLAATASPTPLPPTNTPMPSPTPTFVRYHKVLDPMLGDFVARCQFPRGRHRVTAIGYDQHNREITRDDVWVVVR
jgi:1A family penicillin-binding protein